ncbi:PREDICTED: colorectal mutant cancer protein-like isoform X2 [Priapulus caudatus]|uniref:Colorectal mutant cancer protein-like isoform X2 n=1 Tax=Priapulus caudatus TaxID=37621 RepID=A0ABM1FB84_PRICU|nr:PREDICTED: colorectal mutant cancer protein-like isoform X2 [Priapulus caudatus]
MDNSLNVNHDQGSCHEQKVPHSFTQETGESQFQTAEVAALSTKVIKLSDTLQHATCEKNAIEKQLKETQESERRFHNQAIRHEERLVELHSVIAELRKKFSDRYTNVIREEDETSEHSCPSNCGLPDNNENNPSEFENEDLNAELSRVVTELESAIKDGKHISPLTTEMVAKRDEGCLDRAVDAEEQAIQVCQEMELLTFDPRVESQAQEGFAEAVMQQLQKEKYDLQQENQTILYQMGLQETELNKLKATLGGVQEERDRLRNKAHDLQNQLNMSEVSSQPGSVSMSPTKHVGQTDNRHEALVGGGGGGGGGSVAKLAERVKLKKHEYGERLILGPEITSVGLPNAKVAEHLASSLQGGSNVEEILHGLLLNGSSVSESKVQEFEVEIERLNGRIEHLKSQNDLLNLTLEESKSQCERLTVLMGKYESNNTALQLAVSYSDQAIEAYEALTALSESEQGLLLANCRAAGLGSLENAEQSDEEEVASLLERFSEGRRHAETMVKQLLQQLDRNCGVLCAAVTGCSPHPWEELSSSHDYTTSTTSSTSSSCDTEFTKMDEQRLRDYVRQLRADRAAVRMTVMELESVHVAAPRGDEPPLSVPDAKKLDLENAVLMQELMAMKEEKTELKAINYMLGKEKKALELHLDSCESREHASNLHITHLKATIAELEEKLEKLSRKVSEGHEYEENPDEELAAGLAREAQLKSRIQELLQTLESISSNAEDRYQQSTEFVNDLKKANSALISAFEKSKKKHQNKIKRLEQQMTAMLERHTGQVRTLQQRIRLLEEENSRPPTNETSL